MGSLLETFTIICYPATFKLIQFSRAKRITDGVLQSASRASSPQVKLLIGDWQIGPGWPLI